MKMGHGICINFIRIKGRLGCRIYRGAGYMSRGGWRSSDEEASINRSTGEKDS